MVSLFVVILRGKLTLLPVTCDRSWLIDRWLLQIVSHSRPYESEGLEERVKQSVDYLTDDEVASYVQTLRGRSK